MGGDVHARAPTRLSAAMSPASRWPDRLVAVVLAAATLWYVQAWPRDFLVADEGTFLYEAKRVLAGQVMYRDFFDLITPAAVYAMALVFRVFGTSIDVARLTFAGVHAFVAVACYGLARRLGAGRTLATAAGLAQVAIAFPAFPIASPHWISTACVVALAVVASALARDGGTRRAAGLGLLTGLLVLVQQQKGVIVGGGVLLAILLRALLARTPARAMVRQVFLFAAAVALTVVPPLAALALSAGLAPLYTALVAMPLQHYPAFHTGHTWGSYPQHLPEYTVLPALVNHLPAIVAPALVGGAWLWRRQGSAGTGAAVLTVALLTGAAAASIAYNPDYVHLALIAPTGIVLLAWALASALRAVGVRRLEGLLGIALVLFLGRIALDNVARRRILYPVSRVTEFGRVDLPDVGWASLLEDIRAHVRPHTPLFCYESCAGLYLLTGTVNPTPYQLAIPGYSPPSHMEAVVRVLATRRPPFVVAVRPWGIQGPDPIAAFLEAHYEKVRLTDPSFTTMLLRRRTTAPP